MQINFDFKMKQIDPNLPINKTAKYVVQKSKDQWCKFNNGTNVMSKIPLPITTLKAIKSNKKDLTGIKFGRLTVLGVFAPLSYRSKMGKSLRWVVRCSCGYYTVRREKTIKKSIGNDMCNECKEKRYLSKHADFLKMRL